MSADVIPKVINDIKITASLFEAGLKCLTKCFLLSRGERGSDSRYAHWVQSHNESYRARAIQRLRAGRGSVECATGRADAKNLTRAEWRLAMDLTAAACNMESTIPMLERLPEGQGEPARFVPIQFVYTNKLAVHDKLRVAFDALVLSEMVGRTVDLGKIVHGDNHARVTVKTATLTGEVRKMVGRIGKLLSSQSPPDLFLNRHCGECEFQVRCRQKAIEKEDLSLLAGMTTEERKRFNSKGIFTVTQLSYTFRPRRRPKKLASKREKYHHSLRALAIRENKTHLVGNPELKVAGTPVYLDVEGLPDRDFYYLIGLRFNTAQGTVQRSLWADSRADEKEIWTDFLGILSEIENPVLVHYGSYETVFLKRMRNRYGDLSRRSSLDSAINSAVNLLSFIFAQIYFPTYSNGLKDVARFLGFSWSEPDVSGAQSIVWRHEWEESGDSAYRQMLITYNSEDCEALELIAAAIAKLNSKDNAGSIGNGAVAVDSLKSLHTMWPKFSSPFSEFEQINRAARWDYQRDRVYVWTSNHIKRISAKKQTKRKSRHRAAKVILYPEHTACPTCNREGRRSYRATKVLHDLHIGRFSLRSRLAKYWYTVFWCSTCHASFGFPKEFWPGSKYGRNIVAYVLYHAMKLYVPRAIIVKSLNRLLGTNLNPSIVHGLKKSAAAYYQETHRVILDNLIKGSLLHVDETRVSIRGKTAYVWVFTNLHEVSYLYSDTREGGFVRELLKEFKGVLISDFYAAYDSLGCPQQKCLIHLMRDLNAEVLNAPYDEELKRIVRSFAELLRPMVETVDRFGLKKHFLRKHLAFVERFYDRLGKTSLQSEAAIKCRQRFEKNRGRLFTFLHYDGVPWNNNNAEHAIKAFARLREVIRGTCTADAVQQLLVLLGICQTCEYQGTDFLDFLRSGEKDIYALAERKGQYGGPNAPRIYRRPEGDQPGECQGDQRDNRKKGQLSLDGVQKLNAIGFKWTRLDPEEPFVKGFQETLKYKEETGYPDAPLRYETPEGYKLGRWQYRLRCNYKQNKLTPDSIQRFDAIGFTWVLFDKLFEKGFQETLKRKEETGNPNVSHSYRTPEGYSLGTWQSLQRVNYKKGKLSTQKIGKLETIGFVFAKPY